MISLKRIGRDGALYQVVCQNAECKHKFTTMGYMSAVCPECGYIGILPHSAFASAYSRIIHHNLETT